MAYRIIGWALDVALIVFICLTDNLTARLLAGAIVAGAIVAASMRTAKAEWESQSGKQVSDRTFKNFLKALADDISV